MPRITDMPTSDTGKTKGSLPSLNEQATTGKAKAIALADPPSTHPAIHTAPNKKPRKKKAPEDVDSDYAEEAEDFFYGEGM